MLPFASMNFNFLCTKDWILGDVPLQLWEATPAYGPTANALLTRFLHNKPMFYLDNFLRCYLSYLSADFLVKAFSLLGLGLFIFGVYQAIRQRRKWLLSIVLMTPLFPLFQFPAANLAQGVLLYGSQLALILFGLQQLIKILIQKFRAP